MPQPPGRVEPEPTSILLGVNHEYPARADHQVVDVCPAPGDGQVIQGHPPLLLQPVEQPGGAPLPRRAALPSDGLRAGPEPQPPAGRHSSQPAEDQPQLGRQQAAKNTRTGTDPEGCGRPPGHSPSPGGPLGRASPPPGGLGGAAWPAHAGPHPHRHHRPIGAGSGQQLIWVVAEVGEDRLEVDLAERSHGAAEPVVVVEGEPSGTGYGGLLPGGASRRPAPGLAGHAAREVAAGWGARWSAGRRGCGRQRVAWRGPARSPCGSTVGRPAGLGSWGSGPRARLGSVIW
jgi:hypothetical protein